MTAKKTVYTGDFIVHAATQLGLSKKDAGRAVTIVCRSIVMYCCEDAVVSIKQFGRFFLTLRQAKHTTHPITKKRYVSPAKKIVLCAFSRIFFKER